LFVVIVFGWINFKTKKNIKKQFPVLIFLLLTPNDTKQTQKLGITMEMIATGFGYVYSQLVMWERMFRKLHAKHSSLGCPWDRWGWEGRAGYPLPIWLGYLLSDFRLSRSGLWFLLSMSLSLRLAPRSSVPLMQQASPTATTATATARIKQEQQYHIEPQHQKQKQHFINSPARWFGRQDPNCYMCIIFTWRVPAAISRQYDSDTKPFPTEIN
jgi:hypothetical protein